MYNHIKRGPLRLAVCSAEALLSRRIISNMEITTGNLWQHCCRGIKLGHHDLQSVEETVCYHVLSHQTGILPLRICSEIALLLVLRTITSKRDHYARQSLVETPCYHV